MTASDPDRPDDLIGVATRALLEAVLVGAALGCLVLWAVRGLVGQAKGTEAVTTGPAPWLLLGGTLASMVVAAGVAWRRLWKLSSYYRRGGMAVVAALTTFLVTLVVAPVNHFFGRGALLGIAAVAGAGAVVLERAARR